MRFLFRTLYQRAPNPTELRMATEFLDGEPQPALRTVALPLDDAAPPRKNKKNQAAQKDTSGDFRELNVWERFTQVMMLANEAVFLN